MTNEELEAELTKAKHLLKFALGVLNKFDYDPQLTDYDTATFSGEVSCDWFYAVKNDIEKFVS